MECNNDINSMIDIAKVADLVLLLTDASFGFEMEIFEFLNICQVRFTEAYSSCSKINDLERLTGAWIPPSNGRSDSSGHVQE